jgi:hypothetical protein
MQPLCPRHIDVQKNQIGPAVPEFQKSIVATFCLNYGAAFRDQGGEHRPADLWLFSYEQNRGEYHR